MRIMRNLIFSCFFLAVLSVDLDRVIAGDFQKLFDGKSLAGWEGNPKFWRVENGCITGQTTADNPTKGNTFLIWRGGQVGDFELRLKYRIHGGNSGIQYRSEEVDKWVLKGYQADIDASLKFTGILYEEKGRGILAQRGTKVEINSDGQRRVIGKTTSEETILQAINKDGWNDYRIVARGNRLIHEINGHITVSVTDNEESKRRMTGLLGLQLHAGPPMKIEFKDILYRQISKPKKVAFLAGRRSHGYGAHEHYAGCRLLANYLTELMPEFEADVFREGWPKGGIETLKDYDAIVVYCDGGGGHLLNPHIEEFDQLMDRGVGLACLHYAVETPKGKTGDAFLEWIGGYFETHWSVNPHWTAKFESFPDHPVANGLTPFEIHDEWYFHMRFRPGMKGVTPILSAHPPKSTMSRPDGPHSGNPAVREAIAKGEIQHVAWAAERENDGRGFGFTGGHVHWNWGDTNFRKVVLNAIVWIAHGQVPEHGVGGPDPSRAELEKNQDFPKPDQSKQKPSKPSRSVVADKLSNARFQSKLITTTTPDHAVDIEADITGAKKLFLVVLDGGNGYSCDWADWIDPKLIGPKGELKLTDLKWKSARSDWGRVQVDRNAGGGELRVHGKAVHGIGTHANSVIEYELPAGYSQFVAKGGLDEGGTNQQSGNATSVQFLVFTEDPSRVIAKLRRNTEGSHDPADAVANLDVHPELQATLFAAEPLLLSPSNIDIDAKGRVWVCEIVNYRRHRGKRPEGDRILILEDSDGDGMADATKVFYQGTDIDSPHGVTVLGNRVIVSAGENVLVFTDSDGDDKPDDKQVLFTGISGTQHDHGIHKFVFGPDGKLYFNFGNEGKQLKDPQTGKYVVDKAGNEVREHRRPYQQGMIFRCNLDGSELETLAWNFRNNWMVAVDSFGTIWQSDNDDDGNEGVRINFVMEYGNYGYRDERTGAGWREPRTGMHSQRAMRHWHQNDPGVVPNLLHTGAGSPTGIMVYEGDLLPKLFQNTVIHCDAGPSVVRAYPVAESGAGFRARIVNMLQGVRDRWFRPSDVQSAPDGSLIVADWYDPGVGGHAMGDLDRGRLFRVMPKGHSTEYRPPKIDVKTIDGALTALQNPNNESRYLAWTALHQRGADAEPALLKLWQSDKARMRARALWLLGKIDGRGSHYVNEATNDSDHNIRITGLRLARQLDHVDTLSVVKKLVNDSSPQVRRECAIALRFMRNDEEPELWAQLAMQHDGDDRWYLEALGIGAELDWDRCLTSWLTKVGDNWQDKKANRDIVWRSRATMTPRLLATIILDPRTPDHELPRYFRAFDLLDGQDIQPVIAAIAFAPPVGDEDRQKLVTKEAFERLGDIRLDDENQRMALERALEAARGTEHFVDLVRRFDVESRYPDLLEIIRENPYSTMAIAAIRTLLEKNRIEMLEEAVRAPSESAIPVIAALGNSADNRAVNTLANVLDDDHADLEKRRQAFRALTKLRKGAERLIEEAEAGDLDERLSEVAAVALTSSPFGDIRKRAAELFPRPKAKGEGHLASLPELARMRGNADNGSQVFATTGKCATCHVVNGKGKEVGPDLSKIGSKLSREAMFEAIIYPSAGISHNYENYTAILRDGNVTNGILASEKDSEIVLKDAEGIERRIPRTEVEELIRQPLSLMPNDISNLMTQQELVDLVEYLMTLRGE